MERPAVLAYSSALTKQQKMTANAGNIDGEDATTKYPESWSTRFPRGVRELWKCPVRLPHLKPDTAIAGCSFPATIS